MGTVRYNVMNGRVLSETRNGVQRDYQTDATGNTLALWDNTQTKTDTFDYFAYGKVANRTGTTPTPFQFGGGLGYYQNDSNRTHVRARNFYVNLGKWSSQDPIGFDGGDYNLYRYARNRVLVAADPSGLLTLNDTTYLKEWELGSSGTYPHFGQPTDCCGKHKAKWQFVLDKERFGYIVQKVVFSNDTEKCPYGDLKPVEPLNGSLTYWEAWFVDGAGKFVPVDFDDMHVSRKLTGWKGTVEIDGAINWYPLTNPIRIEITRWANDPTDPCYALAHVNCTSKGKPSFWQETDATIYHGTSVGFHCCCKNNTQSNSGAYPKHMPAPQIC